MRTVLTLTTLLLWPTLASAAMQCGPLDLITRELSTKYHESPVGKGAVKKGMDFVVLSTADGSTWTAMIVMAEDQIGCIFSSGEDWKLLLKQPHGTGL